MILYRPEVVMAVLFVIASLSRASSARADTYQMNLRTDIEKGHVECKMTLRYQNASTRPLRQLRLRLDPNLDTTGRMTITSVRDTNGMEFPWRYVPFKFGKLSSERGQLAIDLAEPLEANSELELQVTYLLDHSGLINKEMLTFQDDPYHSFDAWYPKAMTLAGDGWSINDDRLSQYRVTIELPAAFQSVASTGRPVGGNSGEAGGSIFHLEARDARGLTIYASPLWEEHRRIAAGVDIGVHISAENQKWAPRILEAAADVIAFYRQEYGEYPGDHLEIICPGSSTGRAHGSSATCHGITVWIHSRFEGQYRWLIAHEIAHQYFGTSIGIERREIAWAPIGLGMMMNHQYMVERRLGDAAIKKTMRWFYLEAVRRGFDTTLSQPVEVPLRTAAPWSSGWNMSLMHGKAYEVCTMLEDLLGAEKFHDMVRTILKDKRGRLLSGQEFVEYCKNATEEPLDWLIADWIDGDLSLDYAVTNVEPTTGTLEISKIGRASFPVIVEIETEHGKKLRRRIDQNKAVNRISFATSDAVKTVVIDPSGIYPDVDVSNNSWPQQPINR